MINKEGFYRSKHTQVESIDSTFFFTVNTYLIYTYTKQEEQLKQIIFSDINDTIKPENGNISAFCIDAIKALKHKIELVLVSGKNRQKTEEFATAYGGSRYIISSNGGEVFDTKTRKVIYSAEISKAALEKLYLVAKEYDLRFILNVDADFRFTTRVKYFDGSEKQFAEVDDVLLDYNVIGGLITEIPDNLVSEIKKQIFETEGVVVGNTGNNKGNNFIDFISEYSNKGVAIKMLLKHLKADYKNTISIGNERNDVPMFLATYHTVAVANACEEIKQMVDEVVDSVENDGFAKFLMNLNQNK